MKSIWREFIYLRLQSSINRTVFLAALTSNNPDNQLKINDIDKKKCLFSYKKNSAFSKNSVQVETSKYIETEWQSANPWFLTDTSFLFKLKRWPKSSFVFYAIWFYWNGRLNHISSTDFMLLDFSLVLYVSLTRPISRSVCLSASTHSWYVGMFQYVFSCLIFVVCMHRLILHAIMARKIRQQLQNKHNSSSNNNISMHTHIHIHTRPEE